MRGRYETFYINIAQLISGTITVKELEELKECVDAWYP